MAIHTQSQKIAFSLNKQSAIGTSIADAAFDRLRPIENFAPVTFDRTTINDANWFGKGHTFPTFQEEVAEVATIQSQTRPATDIELLWALGFVMGGLASVDNTTFWTHTFTWYDILTSAEPHYTALLEEYAGGLGDGYRKKLTGAVLQQVQLTGDLGDFVKMAVQGFARQYATEATATTPASVTAGSFFKTKLATLNFGPSAAPDVSAKLISFDLTFTNNARPVYRPGQAAGQEFLIQRAELGTMRVTGNFVVEADVTRRDLFLNDTLSEAILVLVSEDQHGGAAAKDCEIKLPNVRISSEAFGEDGATMTYTMTLDEGAAIKVGAAEPAQVEMDVDEDNLKLLVNSP